MCIWWFYNAIRRSGTLDLSFLPQLNLPLGDQYSNQSFRTDHLGLICCCFELCLSSPPKNNNLMSSSADSHFGSGHGVTGKCPSKNGCQTNTWELLATVVATTLSGQTLIEYKWSTCTICLYSTIMRKLGGKCLVERVMHWHHPIEGSETSPQKNAIYLIQFSMKIN